MTKFPSVNSLKAGRQLNIDREGSMTMKEAENDFVKGKIEMEECTAKQRELAEAVRDYMCRHLDQHMSLTQLAREFHVSVTTVKESFRIVYNLPPYQYFKRLRMTAAAQELQDTDKSVLKIAGTYGYENASKFAKAFRDVMGVSPREFRKKKQKMSEWSGKLWNGLLKLQDKDGEET